LWKTHTRASRLKRKKPNAATDDKKTEYRGGAIEKGNGTRKGEKKCSTKRSV